MFATAVILLVLAICAEAAGGPQWHVRHPAVLARTEVAAARIDHYIYVVGGFVAPDARTSAAVERYDLRRDRWTRAPDMPIALNHAAAAAWRGHLYVVGGYRGAGGGLATESAALLRFDPQRRRWSRLPNMPTARAALAVGVLGSRLYAAGGAAGGRALATLEIFDLRARRWRAGPAMGKPREHLAGAVAGGAFYALAGRAAGEGNFAVAERYVPARRRWERLAPMRKPRGGIAAAAVGRDVVVVGGEEAAGTIAPVEAYDPRRRRWRFLAPMRTARHGLGAVTYRDSVYALEGGPQPGLSYSNAIEVLRVR